MNRRFDYTFRALGSLFVVSVFSETDSGLDDFVQALRERILAFESEFSRFVPDSSLSILNRSGDFEVSETFLRLLSKSRECFERSEGYFNPLFDVSRLGYSHDFESGKFEIADGSSPYRTDFENVRVSGREVFLEPGMKLDF